MKLPKSRNYSSNINLVLFALSFLKTRLNGFLLAIGKIDLLSDVGQTFQDEPTLWVPIKLNFVLFVPERGRRVHAVVSKLGKKHIGKIFRMKLKKATECKRIRSFFV